MRYLLLFFILPFLQASELPYLNESDYVQSIHVIHGEWVETENDLSCGSLELKRIFQPQARHAYLLAEGWHFNLPDLLEQEIPRRKVKQSPQDPYLFEYDEAHRLIKMEKESGLNESISIEHHPENHSLTAKASNGETVHYDFDGAYLSKVKKEGGAEISYRYSKHPYERRPLITEKRIEGRETLLFEYWELPEEDQKEPLKSLRWGKIKSLSRLSHLDGKKELVCAIDYLPRSTTVTYGTGVKAIYRFNEIEQIESIETYVDDLLYRTQEIEWKENLVSSKTTKAHNGFPHLKETFSYDSRSLLIEESITGVLTGETDDSETYKKRYHYDEEGNLILIEEDSGLATSFSYTPQCPLLKAKLVCEKDRVLMTTHYRYNDQEQLTEEIEEDGKSRKSFSEVIQRDKQGAPLLEVSGFYRFQDNEKIICRLKETGYDEQGREIYQSMRYPDGEEISCKEKHYDLFGRLIEEKENGETRTYRYAEEGNLITSILKKDHEEKETHYDPTGKPIVEIERGEGKVDRVTRYSYDFYKRLISIETDAGLKKTYSYDSLGRKTEETVQLWEDPPSTTRFSYDIMDHLICIEDDQGLRTTSTYNARGQPLLVTYPDGTKEEFRYTADGRITLAKAREGIRKEAERDLFDRLIHETLYGMDGALIEESCYLYNGYELIEESSTNGRKAHYTFDERGRKIFEQIEPACVQVEYSYDDKDRLISKREYVAGTILESVKNRQSEKWELFDSEGNILLCQSDSPQKKAAIQEEWRPLFSGQQVICQIFHDDKGVISLKFLDPLERAICEEKRSPLGTLLQKQTFSYDSQGRVRTQTISKISGGKETGEIRNSWKIGPCGRLEEVIENEGVASQEATSYTYDAYGRIDQIVKPDGMRLTHHYDSAGRLSRFNSSDLSVDYLMEYDLSGKLTAAHNLVTRQTTIRSYTEQGQVAEEILENGLKITFGYDPMGRKQSIVLPDDSSIEYHFSNLFMKEVIRKDAQGNPLYTHRYTGYDLQGHPIEQQMIGDLGILSLKMSPHSKQLSTPYYKETLSLDSEGRISSRQVNDKAPVAYSYNLLNQLSSEQGAQTLKHQYESNGQPILDNLILKHDLNGNLIEKIENGICYQYRYDALNRLIAAYKNGKETLSCRYDAFHRRVQTSSSSIKKSYLYDGNREIGAFSSAGEPLELRILGRCQESELNGTVAIELNGKIYAPIHDLLGSISLLVDMKKNIVSFSPYTAFGRAAKKKSQIQSPWGYSGKRQDVETGLIYYGRRYFDPSCKQWISKDPLGFADGANRHLFNNNNPLSFKDHFGLTATKESFPSLKERVLDQLKSIGAKIFHAIRKIQSHVNMDLTTTLDHLIGRGFLLLLGYYKTNHHKGIYGKGEVSDKVRVSFINGILTDYASLYTTLQTLSSSHGGVNIHYIYRPTKGWVYDILHSFLVKLGYVSTQAHTLAQEWKMMIEEMGGVEGGGLIIHYAHSIGTVESLRALSLLTPEEQKMIKIYAFGSPNLSDSSGEAEITHFVSVRDGVSLLDPIGFFNACRGRIANVLFVGTFWGIPLIDHLFSTQCYQDIWTSMGRTFVEWYGTLS